MRSDPATAPYIRGALSPDKTAAPAVTADSFIKSRRETLGTDETFMGMDFLAVDWLWE
jgi:hypothetical protein